MPQVGVIANLYNLRGEGGGTAIAGRLVRDNLTIPAGTARSALNVTVHLL